MTQVRTARRFALTVSLASLLWLGACADKLRPANEDDDGGSGEVPSENLPGPGGAQAQFTRSGDYYHGSIDASGSDWIYIDLETQTQVNPSTPNASDEWDLAFRGSDIKLNGGASGAPPTGVAASVYADKLAEGTPYPFESTDAVPPPSAVDYQTDFAGFLPILPATLAMTTYPEADQAPNRLSGEGDHGWYRNSGVAAGSAITARGNVGYIVQSIDCRFYKLRMTGYSNASGVAGHPQFDLKELRTEASCGSGEAVAPLGRATFTAGSASTTVEVDSSDEEAWVHLDLINAKQVVPASPAADPNGWDIAWKRSDIKLNGGVSGTGSVEIHAGLRDDWAARTTAPTGDYHTDETDELAFQTYPARENGGECSLGIDGDFGWYYYSGFCDKGQGTHHISPREVVYVVRGRDGKLWKLRVLDYYDDAGTSAHPSFEYAPIGG